MKNETLSGRGGSRPGAGRPQKEKEQKAKKYTFWLYQWEVQTVRDFVKQLRNKTN